MSWRVTADPQRFFEAINWFRSRVPVTPDEFRRLSDEARRRAVTVANVAQLDLIHHVLMAVDRAIEQGTDYRDFAKEVGERLARAWGVEQPHRVELIFQQNVQTAYAAGRYRQMTDLGVLAARPFWMYDAVIDTRTSALCDQLNGTVLPADDPWWDTRYPPNHFNCRAGVRTLTRQAAQRRGVTASPPLLDPPVQFRSRPSLSDWEPDLSKYPPELRQLAERRLVNASRTGYDLSER